MKKKSKKYKKSVDEKPEIPETAEISETAVIPETERLNYILNELTTLNNNFKRMEELVRSNQPMMFPMKPMVSAFKNPLTDVMNNFDFEKLLSTLAHISQIYKSNDNNKDKDKDKE